MSPSVISLQGCKPRQHGSVISPRGLACASGCDRFKQVQGIGLHAYGYLGVAIGGLKINMPQPAPNDVNLHACLEEMDRCSMPEHVRREVGARRRHACRLPEFAIMANTLVDAEAGHPTAGTADEHKAIR